MSNSECSKKTKAVVSYLFFFHSMYIPTIYCCELQHKLETILKTNFSLGFIKQTNLASLLVVLIETC
jgi:hypothetical protein